MSKRQIHTIIQEEIQKLKSGQIPPWKVEYDLESDYGIKPPDNLQIAAKCRQGFLEETTGEKFIHIQIPEKPYKSMYFCQTDNLNWEIDAHDRDFHCSLCGKEMKALGEYGPLVANYIGGTEIYFSYAGSIKVKGDINQEFTNFLVYGTGLGPIGVTRGSHIINKLGGAAVKVAEYAQAVRCNGYIFSSAEMRQKARAIIEKALPQLKQEMDRRLEEFSGRISSVDFNPVDSEGHSILFIDFVADFRNFRGHGDISRAVGFAKNELENLLKNNHIPYTLSVIAQGHDGDLKPSPKNKRGRCARAEVRIPLQEFENTLKVDTDKFLSFVKLDALGAQQLGCQFYSGMGGEIVPAFYKATQVNPQSPLVSAFQNIYAKIENGELVYGVEMPNIEVGIASNREGIISPVGREALRFMGIHTAEEFAAALAAQVLAGEFNLALEISREKLYAS